jgi:hypothetical protein
MFLLEARYSEARRASAGATSPPPSFVVANQFRQLIDPTGGNENEKRMMNRVTPDFLRQTLHEDLTGEIVSWRGRRLDPIALHEILAARDRFVALMGEPPPARERVEVVDRKELALAISRTVVQEMSRQGPSFVLSLPHGPTGPPEPA